MSSQFFSNVLKPLLREPCTSELVSPNTSPSILHTSVCCLHPSLLVLLTNEAANGSNIPQPLPSVDCVLLATDTAVQDSTCPVGCSLFLSLYHAKAHERIRSSYSWDFFSISCFLLLFLMRLIILMTTRRYILTLFIFCYGCLSDYKVRWDIYIGHLFLFVSVFMNVAA